METAMTIDEYLQSLPAQRRDIIEALHQFISETAPNLKAKMWGKFIGYGHYHYRYESGREGEWFLIGLANNKSYLSLYICAANDDGYLAERNKDRLGNIKVGKSCIKFRKLEDLNLDVVAELICQAEKLSGVEAER